MEKGKVYIVGAGPGDERLVTLRCRELIENADVIVYDRLASEKLLCYSKNCCEIIYAGKMSKNHTISQYEINNILVKKAKQNKSVLRLKGGDPFIFGRGAEEIERLFDEGIKFEVVPGISSFYSACAYAGIPITHRDYSSSIHIFTGHKKNDCNIDFKSISKLKGTIVFFMGIKNLENITNRLIIEGFNKSIPSAVIQWGTTPNQKVVVGDVSNIAEKIKEEDINDSAIVIIGDVVKLRDKIEWQKYRPLWGKKIAITRTIGKIGEFEKILSEKGAYVFPLPTINIEQPHNYLELDNAINNITYYNWIIFTSVNGVKGFFERMKKLNKDIRCLFNIKIFAIGEKTKYEIEKKGIFIDLIPKKYNSIESIKLLKDSLNENDKILYPTSDISDNSIINLISNNNNISVHKVVAYTNSVNKSVNMNIINDIKNGNFDAIAFASSSQAINFMKMTNKQYGNAKICSIGFKTTKTLNDLGVYVDVTSDNSTVESLAYSVLKIFS